MAGKTKKDGVSHTPIPAGTFDFKVVSKEGRTPRIFGGRFRADHPLAASGMATVYRGRDLETDREVAIKVLRPALSRGLHSAARFRREAETHATLNHPAIVPLLAFGKEGDDLYLVTPYVTGTLLSERLHERTLTATEWAPLLGQIAGALHFAHQKGVIHRDLKPSNLILDAATGRMMVMDFGVALHTRRERLTDPGIMLGTPTYMAPELFDDRVEVSPATDVYSLGVLTYEALAGRPPFTDQVETALVYKHCLVPPEPVWTFEPSVERDVGLVVMRALEKDPSKRWQSCPELAEAFEAASRR